MIWNNEILSHLLVSFIYFLIVSILRLVSGETLGLWGMLGMWGGTILGTFFLDIDHLIYWFVTHSEEVDSKEAKDVVGDVRNIRSIGEIKEKGKKLFYLGQKFHNFHNRLIFHSLIGQVILLILAFYLLTSSGSIFGAGMIMSMNLHLLKDEWMDYKKDKGHLTDWLFWQVKDEGMRKYSKEYLIGASLVFLGLTIIFI